MNRFNLRVYGIIINEKNEILVADERRFETSFTKFPGGGLEFGEGLKDGITRELKEELGLNAEIGDLFFVNDFFQVSAFRDTDQLLSFYYRVNKIDYSSISNTNHEVPLKEDGEKFRWIPLTELNAEMFTFPIDKVVAGMLLR